MVNALPKIISDYLEAVNRHDTNAMFASFVENAVVQDDGQELRGGEIKAWIDKTTAEYALSLEVIAVDQDDEDVVVTTLTSGNFEGSPFRFKYHFKIIDSKISALRIDFAG